MGNESWCLTTSKKKEDTGQQSDTPITDALLEADKLHEEVIEGALTEHQFIEEMRKKCPDIDPHLFVSGYYDGRDENEYPYTFGEIDF
jgi:hypothetical protein|tara:strand:+ start:32 stop:295 length:264 start_codon:yes stop_codon:yes gene_type:complete